MPASEAKVDSRAPVDVSTVRTTGREYVNPVDYQHPFDSMARLAQTLALRYDANRTRHAYYRQLRLPHEHFARDPALLTEARLRDYFLFPKLRSVAGGGRLLSRISVLSQPHRPQY